MSMCKCGQEQSTTHSCDLSPVPTVTAPVPVMTAEAPWPWPVTPTDPVEAPRLSGDGEAAMIVMRWLRARDENRVDSSIGDLLELLDRRRAALTSTPEPRIVHAFMSKKEPLCEHDYTMFKPHESVVAADSPEVNCQTCLEIRARINNGPEDPK